MPQPRLSAREIATLLASLRLFQTSAEEATGPGEEDLLDNDEIDDLCERINFDF